MDQVFQRGAARGVEGGINNRNKVNETDNFAKYNSKGYAPRVCTPSYDILVKEENMRSEHVINY